MLKNIVYASIHSILFQIHDRNLLIHAWTFRNEHETLIFDYGLDPYAEFEEMLRLGVDGYFTDFPGTLDRFFQIKAAEMTNS